jgi:RNA polymerase sigma-70 factor (ECF subfamily)
VASNDLASLLDRVALRDRAVFTALYSAAAPKLFAVCLRILNDKADAEDALQEVFVKIWHQADRFAATGTGSIRLPLRDHPQSFNRSAARKAALAQPIDEPGFDLEDHEPDPCCHVRGQKHRRERDELEGPHHARCCRQAAGLVETLHGEGPFTVFAPTNSAFEALPAGEVDTLLKGENKDKLVKVLTCHVVAQMRGQALSPK